MKDKNPVTTDRIFTVEEAQQVVLEAIVPFGHERMPLLSCLGRVLAEPVTPSSDIPPYDNSSVDGYAVRAADTREATSERPCLLETVEEIPAGKIPQNGVASGQAARIMTGAVMPVGADAVVMVENTHTRERTVEILKPVAPGQNVRYRGEDVRAGEPALAAGIELGPGEIGLLASFRRSFVTVTRKPTVAILSTGDEVVDIDERAEPGQIVNSNSYSLAALVRKAGATPILQGIVRDTEKDVKEAIKEALCADFVLSTGGVSVGDYDFVKQALIDLGADMRLWRVRMKPGKPLAFGVIENKPYFGLPGNPVSCMVSFLLFTRPALRKAMGYPASEWHLPMVAATLTHPIRAGGDRRHYLRARVFYRGDRFYASAATGQGSGMLSSMTGTNGLIVVETGVTAIAENSEVETLLMRPWQSGG
ncbi:MAG: molybdopterin molybdotransferase MoeA [candidate division Zixibacteria bacterium]|nr:molybdopterin molybdotransferase MoeA [candidate division Zixibacteria bacterium]